MEKVCSLYSTASAALLLRVDANGAGSGVELEAGMLDGHQACLTFQTVWGTVGEQLVVRTFLKVRGITLGCFELL